MVQKLYGACASALKQPDVKTQLDALDIDVVGSTPQQFTGFLEREVAFYAKLIKTAGIPSD